jgi:hypothetical protein
LPASPPTLNTFVFISKQGNGNYYLVGPAGYNKAVDFKTFQHIPASMPFYSGTKYCGG